MTELEYRDNGLETDHLLREALPELCAQSGIGISVRLTNINGSTELAIKTTRLQDSTVGLETHGAHRGIPLNTSNPLPAVPLGLQSFLKQLLPITSSLTAISTNVATGIFRLHSTPFFVIVPKRTDLNQPLLGNAQHSVQLQQTSTNTDPVPFMARQIATSKPISGFTEPANLVLPNLSA